MFGFNTGWDLLGVVLQIALINVVLSGDNAVVIAPACRAGREYHSSVADYAVLAAHLAVHSTSQGMVPAGSCINPDLRGMRRPMQEGWTEVVTCQKSRGRGR